VALAGGLRGLRVERRAERIASRVEVTVHPREVGSETAALWCAGHSIRLEPGLPRTIGARYRDPDEAAVEIGALSVITPEAETDFNATTQAGGGGSDVTASVQVTLAVGASGAEITLLSTYTGGPVYVHNLTLRGTPLRRYPPISVVREDEDSFLSYGRRVLRVDMPLQADPAVAADLAGALLVNHRRLAGWPAITLEATASDELLAAALSVDVGSRLSLSEPALGLDGSGCFVERIRHDLRRGGAAHRVVWECSPADLFAVWALGSSAQAALGTGSTLGY
jgi:hypothetical protein